MSLGHSETLLWVCDYFGLRFSIVLQKVASSQHVEIRNSFDNCFSGFCLIVCSFCSYICDGIHGMDDDDAGH